MQQQPDRNRVDKDPNNLFQSGHQGVQGKRKAMEGSREGAVLIEKVQKLALHAVSNIVHKDQLAVFVPASYLLNLATNHAGMPATPLHNRPSTSKLSAHRRHTLAS